MPFSASISSPSSSSLSLLSIQTRSPLSFFTPKTLIFTRTTIPHLPSSSLLASRRPRDFINGKDDFVDDTWNWNRKIKPEYGFDEDYEGEEDDDDHEEEDRSLDLLLRFVENVFRKISKRARKAVRSILPVSISTKLVGFSVNGVLILAFLWILKAFLENKGRVFGLPEESSSTYVTSYRYHADSSLRAQNAELVNRINEMEARRQQDAERIRIVEEQAEEHIRIMEARREQDEERFRAMEEKMNQILRSQFGP